MLVCSPEVLQSRVLFGQQIVPHSSRNTPDFATPIVSVLPAPGPCSERKYPEHRIMLI